MGKKASKIIKKVVLDVGVPLFKIWVKGNAYRVPFDVFEKTRTLSENELEKILR